MKKIMLGLAVAALAANALAIDRYELDQRVHMLTAKFEDMQARPDKCIPPSILREARGIVLLDRTKAGFLFAYQGGSGVAMVKDPMTQAWSPTAFVKANEASLGLQIGGEQNFYVIVLMNDTSAHRLTESSLQFGGEAGGTAGDASGGVAGNFTGSDGGLLIYVDHRGLYGGAAIKGGAVDPDKDANSIYYDHFMTMADILFGRKVQPTDAAHDLAATIDRYSVDNSRARP